MTSTAQKVKEELAHYWPNRRCCQVAELSALLHMDGKYAIRGMEGHCLVTESHGVHTARKIYTLIHALFDVETPLVKVQTSSPRKQNVFSLEIPYQEGFHQVLNEVGVLDSSLNLQDAIPPRLTSRKCCVAASLRGAFLGGGYVSECFKPADLEISCSSRASAESIGGLFQRKGMEPGLRERRGQWVVYLKKRQEISRFMAVVGAHSAYLEWESQTIIRSTRNAVNRLVNCDSANAKRIAAASARQRDVVSRLMNAGLLRHADQELVELAIARMENPHASLSELGRMVDPPVTKSAVQNRMKRLEAMLGQ